jgi:hypothetical protein
MLNLQNRPALLERAYQFTYRLLLPFRRWLKPDGFVEQVFIKVEDVIKGPLFDCRMCGQCVLHFTGMTCPMTCPKEMRNGPCGGVLPNGNCEVDAEMPCVWVQAWDRSRRMTQYGEEILRILPPYDQRLQESSAWINDLQGISKNPPPGWDQ